MSVSIQHFDCLSDGRSVDKVILTNGHGTSVSVITLGATLQSFCFGSKDIVLGFDRAEDYLHSGAYIGATVGRVCNRTDNGRFVLNGQEYTLVCNEEDRHVHLHGGAVGFDKKIWEPTILRDTTDPQVCFSAFSADGEEGYPGNLLLCVSYTLTEQDALILEYAVRTDADTPVNLTNHAYFNLNGCDGNTVHNTFLQIHAEEYTPVTERLIPTGEFAGIADTALDFRSEKLIGDALDNEDDTMRYTGGIDHNFVISRQREHLKEVAVAYSPDTGIRLHCFTDLPGLQVYTGNFLDEQGGKYGLKWGRHQGFCLETQYFANSMNLPNFPSIVLKAGETFRSTTVYSVSMDREE